MAHPCVEISGCTGGNARSGKIIGGIPAKTGKAKHTRAIAIQSDFTTDL
jgi:hypothetical protein